MDDAWYAYTVTLATLMGIHAWVDAVCTVATLFPGLQWDCCSGVYPSLFMHSYTREVSFLCTKQFPH